jgi:hypothetical protein
MTPTRTETPNAATATPEPGDCSVTTDRNAPAGSKNSLGAKSDCNGRPTTDDSVIEAKDEQPQPSPPPFLPQTTRAPHWRPSCLKRN